jgi:hypothetical protein
LPVDTSALQAAVDAAIAEATRSTTTEDGAGVLIAKLAASITTAVTAALKADNDATTVTLAAVTKAISDTTAAFAAADDKLGAAIAAVPA